MRLPIWLHHFLQDLREAVGLSAPRVYQGIDASEWSGVIDFKKLTGKINFAILRCGYGKDLKSQDDTCFQRNVENCLEAGIPYGVYLYAYAQDQSAALSEAEHTLRLIRDTNPLFGIWYDVEDASLPFDKVSKFCKTWCDAILAEGFPCVGIYASLSHMESDLDDPALDPYEKWVAQWNYKCDYPNPGIWQYDHDAVIDGHKVDLNYAYKDYPDIIGDDMTQDKFNEMLENYLQELEKKPADNWAKEKWEKACDKGVFDGTGPRSPLTREQAATVFDRLHLLDKL